MLKCFPCCGLSVVPEEAAQPTADLLAADNQVDAAISAEALRVHNKRLQRCANSLKVNGGRLFLSGVFAQANTVTKNKRIYPKAVLQQEVLRFYKSHVVPGTAFGELDHPSYRSATFQQLHCATLSHQVLALWWRGDELYGIAEVLDTPAGRLARELYMRGYCFGASSRGWSSVAPEVDVKVVLDDLQLITFDLATNPASGAYLFPVSKRFQKPFDRQPAALELCAQQFPGVMPMFPSLDASGVRDARQIQQSMQVAQSVQAQCSSAWQASSPVQPIADSSDINNSAPVAHSLDAAEEPDAAAQLVMRSGRCHGQQGPAASPVLHSSQLPGCQDQVQVQDQDHRDKDHSIASRACSAPSCSPATSVGLPDGSPLPSTPAAPCGSVCEANALMGAVSPAFPAETTAWLASSVARQQPSRCPLEGARMSSKQQSNHNAQPHCLDQQSADIETSASPLMLAAELIDLRADHAKAGSQAGDQSPKQTSFAMLASSTGRTSFTGLRAPSAELAAESTPMPSGSVQSQSAPGLACSRDPSGKAGLPPQPQYGVDQVDPVSDTARRLSRMMQLLEVMRAGFNPGMPLAMSTIMQATASPIKKPVSPAATGTLTAYREPMLAW